jgi:hypothetical protein
MKRPSWYVWITKGGLHYEDYLLTNSKGVDGNDIIEMELKKRGYGMSSVTQRGCTTFGVEILIAQPDDWHILVESRTR